VSLSLLFWEASDTEAFLELNHGNAAFPYNVLGSVNMYLSYFSFR